MTSQIEAAARLAVLKWRLLRIAQTTRTLRRQLKDMRKAEQAADKD